ncbi:BQ5605_C014g07612 [Microbotryum silenes-dioicae]|uniref:BQ5605_C014g07612 protein n=1 Tax=Microbotryum silenes-dioicae TaxID=796604 RepID=A0A2X0LYM3_9BASI|nr:BQ5605_C014g07612 [Microbotryum silenes-dioicae]
MKIAKLGIASWWILSQFGNALAAQQGLRGVNESNGTLVVGEEALRVQAVHQRRDAATTSSDRLRHTSRFRWLATLGKRHFHLAKRDTNGCQNVWEDSETTVPCDESDWVVASANELEDSRQVVVQLDESESSLTDESDERYSAADEEVVDEEDILARGAQDDLGDDEVEEDYYGGSSDDGRSTENECASRDDKNAQPENQDQHSSSDGWRAESHDHSPASDNYLSAPDDDDAQANDDYFSAPDDNE